MVWYNDQSKKGAEGGDRANENGKEQEVGKGDKQSRTKPMDSDDQKRGMCTGGEEGGVNQAEGNQVTPEKKVWT